MIWRLAKSLEKLRGQINAAHPVRSKVSDGSIGDTAHASRASDHNPNSKGVVTAIDVTHDPANGVHGLALAETLKHDSRIKYLIFAGRIWKARTGRWENYTGSNSHHKHLHVSVVADAKGYDSAVAWDLPTTERAGENESVTVDLPTDMPGDVTVQATASEPEKITTADMQGVVTGHSDSLKSILSRFALKVSTYIAMIWASGIAGKALLIIIAIVVIFAIAYEMNKFWPKLKPWAIGAVKGMGK